MTDNTVVFNTSDGNAVTINLTKSIVEASNGEKFGSIGGDLLAKAAVRIAGTEMALIMHELVAGLATPEFEGVDVGETIEDEAATA